MSQNVYVQLRPKEEVLDRLRELILQGEPWVWVRRELRHAAEAILIHLQVEGVIVFWDYDASRSTNGSACYQIEYAAS